MNTSQPNVIYIIPDIHDPRTPENYHKIRSFATIVEQELGLEPGSHTQTFTILVAHGLITSNHAMSVLRRHAEKLTRGHTYGQ